MATLERKNASLLIAVGLTLVSAAALAGSVAINGFNWACEHECAVELGPNGFTLSDSEGGWVHKLGPAHKSLPPRI